MTIFLVLQWDCNRSELVAGYAGLDSADAPRTATVEIGGLSTIQGLAIIRDCRGLEIVGGDLVEVSPPCDLAVNTALTSASRFFARMKIFANRNNFLGNLHFGGARHIIYRNANE